jgi:pimeloyl-ACP methyl ester carboxylesterase
MSQTQLRSRAHAAVDYVDQVEKLSLEPVNQATDQDQHGVAVEAKFITPLDPVIETADGNRLPAVPLQEAHKINVLKDQSEGRGGRRPPAPPRGLSRFEKPDTSSNELDQQTLVQEDRKSATRSLGDAIPPAVTHPLFPPLPLYGPPSLLRNLHCMVFRITAFYLSTAFLAVIVLGSVFTSIPHLITHIWCGLTFRDPHSRRPFHEEEKRRADIRKEEEAQWRKTKRRRFSGSEGSLEPSSSQPGEDYESLEGGPDKLVCDVSYYARRVGLDIEEFKVQTEDGFILTLWHVYNPREYTPASKTERRATSPDIFTNDADGLYRHVKSQYRDGQRRYPVLLVHGLLQSAGAYCTNDDDSLAFFLCKSGYDVWLGNNRCGFNPEHTLLRYSDPRMWAWNIRQMGVMDLPAFMSRVLQETGFEKLGLVCHSQGTTETFVALAKEQRPDLGDKISVFCALAPAVYAGPLIGKMYFKFMRIISPGMFRVFFGIHSFIPLMMTMHRVLPGKIYGAMGYRVFSFLFNWTDTRWDRGLRDRLFQFSPVYVSAESMRWWLGRECFAKHKCILSTQEEEDDFVEERKEESESHRSDRGRTAWYDEHVPPMALWVGGRDELVDGKRLLRRFKREREPYVNLVHTKVIEDYEHLDVLWAIDAVEQVGKEVRQVLWQTMPEDAKKISRGITGVEDDVEALRHDPEQKHQ